MGSGVGRALWWVVLGLMWGVEAGAVGEGAELVVEGWQHRVWAIYPVEKVLEGEELAATALSGGIELSAARGEAEPFVLVLRPKVPLREVSVAWGSFKSTEGAVLPATSFSAQRLGYIHIDEPSGSRIKQPMPYPTGTGLYPDPLLANSGEVRPGHNLQFLVTARVPRETRPGRYEGEVLLRWRREPWMAADKPVEDVVKVAITVRKFALPDPSPLLNTAVANLRALPESARTPERVAAWHQGFKDHRQAPEPVAPGPRLKLDEGSALTVDSTGWEAAVAAMFERGATHVFLPVWGFYPELAQPQGLYFLYHWPSTAGQKWMGAPVCAADKTLTPEFQRLFGSYLEHMHKVLKTRGWLDKAFITTMDEPYTYHTADRAQDTPENNYAVVRNFVALVREKAPGLRTFVTGDPVPGLIGHIDHWCLRNLDHAAAARARAEKHCEVVTFCDNYRVFIDYPALAARSYGWVAWRLGARGWLTYETLGSYRTAWEAPVLVYPQFSGGTVWGMGQMFYPDPMTGAPLPSLRWELMSEGCDDYEYLWLLREVLKKHPHAEARRVLEQAAGEVVGLASEAETMGRTETTKVVSSAVAMRWRAKVGDWIERLGE